MVVPASGISFSLSPGTKIAKLTADSSTAVTHDTPISINAQSISMSEGFFSEDLRGDGKIMDKYSEFDKITGTLIMPKIDLDALAMVTGNSVETSGNNKILEFDSDNFPNYFALGFKSLYNPDTTIADKQFYLHKCKITGIEDGVNDRGYNVVNVNFEAIQRTFDGKYKTQKFLAVAADIAFTDLSS